MTDAFNPQAAADAALEQVLASQWQGVPALVLRSPPGAGKTGVAQRVALQSSTMLDQRCMIVTQTNEQAFDLTRRLTRNAQSLPIHLFARRGLSLPADVASLPNLVIVHDVPSLPQHPSITIGNAAKWSWIQTTEPCFDLQIVDEAFQLPDYRFQLISNLAPRHVLIGDPGQIDPFVNCEIERWRCDPAGPQVSCPAALVKRHPSVLQLDLPVSRRLNDDTVRLIQPAFYPDMPFRAMSQDRSVRFEVAGIMPFDAALDVAAAGASIVMVELPAQITGEADGDLAQELVASLARLLRRRAWMSDDGRVSEVTPDKIGVVCAHVSQVNAVRERLGPAMADVFVETANRFQGIERPFMFVHHPLSGRADATAFHLDAGRLCVMLSRHRIACWVFGRQGISQQLMRFSPMGDRALGIDDDPEYRGWRAHLTLMAALARTGRVFPAVNGLTPPFAGQLAR
ncbi:AAA domain-containing protein [Bradyrhizobium brasilense]|uniref:AAA domain-containing protein n=1 Tax=Bradyrhizobium brasilense TaxID=1419277 RepID=UPI0024B1FD80|nr:AAA domain-containing protein [Bradyrhizobium australafricanum]WFU31692.1 AAA domain-containing protein [Bradyrhizobium australafricanum]